MVSLTSGNDDVIAEERNCDVTTAAAADVTNAITQSATGSMDAAENISNDEILSESARDVGDNDNHKEEAVSEGNATDVTSLSQATVTDSSDKTEAPSSSVEQEAKPLNHSQQQQQECNKSATSGNQCDETSDTVVTSLGDSDVSAHEHESQEAKQSKFAEVVNPVLTASMEETEEWAQVRILILYSFDLIIKSIFNYVLLYFVYPLQNIVRGVLQERINCTLKYIVIASM